MKFQWPWITRKNHLLITDILKRYLFDKELEFSIKLKSLKNAGKALEQLALMQRALINSYVPETERVFLITLIEKLAITTNIKFPKEFTELKEEGLEEIKLRVPAEIVIIKKELINPDELIEDLYKDTVVKKDTTPKIQTTEQKMWDEYGEFIGDKE